jgi:uncharacterized protein (TIGR00730 family)
MKRVCVFCGSSTGFPPVYTAKARELGKELCRRGWGLVYGAGHIGLMGVLADSVLAEGGQVIGVIPQALVDRELAHAGLSELRIVATMHERKALMADLSDAFVALPGGFGTADEFFEILTWAQLKIHQKPIGLLNVAGFFDPLLAWVDRAIGEGFIKPIYRQLIRLGQTPGELLDLLEKEGLVSLPEKVTKVPER